MSNPFAPPGPQPPPSQGTYVPPVPGPAAQPVAGPAAQPAPQHAYAAPQDGYAASGPMWAPQPFTPAPRQSNGLAITAMVLSGLALLSVLAMAAFLFLGPGGSGSWVLSGTVTPIDKGVTDLPLEEALGQVIEDDGGSVDELECPARSQVGQGLVTVCHGSVDGWDWTGVVVFEDDAGSFIVTEY